MKVFLLSDLVVHELVSMQLEGQWLTTEQFSESACLWASRHGLKNQLSEELLGILEREALAIAERLAKDMNAEDRDSPLKRLLLDIPAVNYSDPLSARALAASLEVCRAKLCDCRCARVQQGDQATRREAQGLLCHPALQRLLCGSGARRKTADGGSQD